MAVLGKTYSIITPRTEAVSQHADLATKYYEKVVVAADGLAEAEEVDIFVKTNGKYVPFTMPDGETPAKLTATNAAIELAGGPVYGFLKDSTEAAVGVAVIMSLGAKRR